jgi:hypothetical protein
VSDGKSQLHAGRHDPNGRAISSLRKIEKHLRETQEALEELQLTGHAYKIASIRTKLLNAAFDLEKTAAGDKSVDVVHSGNAR